MRGGRENVRLPRHFPDAPGKRRINIKRLGGPPSRLFDPPGSQPRWPGPFPTGGFFCLQLAAVPQEFIMEKLEREIMQVSKEIAVKFIESQRLSPSNFEEIFPSIYRVVMDTALKGRERLEEEEGDEQ